MAQARRRRVQSRVDDSAATGGVRMLGGYMTILGLVLLVILALVHTRVRYNDLRYQCRQLQQEQGRLENEQNLLTSEVQALANPERIMQVASTQLGMVLPDDQRVVLLFVRPAATAAPAPAVAAAPRTLMGRLLALLGRPERETTQG
jgi:cell division protein FtsL